MTGPYLSINFTLKQSRIRLIWLIELLLTPGGDEEQWGSRSGDSLNLTAAAWVNESIDPPWVIVVLLHEE